MYRFKRLFKRLVGPLNGTYWIQIIEFSLVKQLEMN